MAVGTDTGEQYDKPINQYIERYQNMTGRGTNIPPITTNGEGKVNAEHHVPLAASAELDQDRNPTGNIFIDHRAPRNEQFEQILRDTHEIPEAWGMKHLTDAGMKPADAYKHTHDAVTKVESALTDHLGIKDAYDQHWRDVASAAREPTDKMAHPDAHTSVYGLDQHYGIPAKYDKSKYLGRKGLENRMYTMDAENLEQAQYRKGSRPAAVQELKRKLLKAQGIDVDNPDSLLKYLHHKQYYNDEQTYGNKIRRELQGEETDETLKFREHDMEHGMSDKDYQEYIMDLPKDLQQWMDTHVGRKI